MKKTRVLTIEQFVDLSKKCMSQEVGFDEYYPADTALVVLRRDVVCADMHTQCKSAKTVVRRFFQQLKALCEGYERFENIVSCAISGWDGNGYLKDNEISEHGYNWSVENLGDGEWYIFLNVDMNKNQELAEMAAKI